MAKAGTLSKTRPHVGRSPGRDPELLPHQSTVRCGGSHQRQHQNPSSKGPRLQKSRLSAAEGSAHGGHKDRIHRSSESSLKCGSLRILVQSRFFQVPQWNARWTGNGGADIVLTVTVFALCLRKLKDEVLVNENQDLRTCADFLGCCKFLKGRPD